MVSVLEDELGVALLTRTGRAISLTPTGERLFARTSGPLREVRDVERELLDGAGEPAGLLRVTAPPDIGAAPWCARMFTSYRARYPAVSLHVELTNRVIDLLAESFDLALRPQGIAGSPALVARRLLPLADAEPAFALSLYASPAFARGGLPSTLSEVEGFDCVVHTATTRAGTWSLSHVDGAEARVRPKATIVANDFSFVVQAVLAGAGLALLPQLTATPLLRAEALVEVLPEWGIETGGLYLVWPASRHLSGRVRAFVDNAVTYVASLDCDDWAPTSGVVPTHDS